MAGKSFYEVLEAQVRTDLRKEIEAELRAEMGGFGATTRESSFGQSATATVGRNATAPGIFETWLAANTGKTFFSQTTKAKRAYNSGSQAKSSHGETTAASAEVGAGPRVKEPSATATTLEELCSLELLRRRSGASIGDTYTESELKAAWRRAALKCHPDRFAQDDSLTQSRMSALFGEVCSAYERLASAFEILSSEKLR